MQLLCKVKHMWGGIIGVKGTTYDIGTEGVVDNVTPEHAEVLLQNVTGWAPCRTPAKAVVKATPKPEAAAPAPKKEKAKRSRSKA